MLRRLRNQVVLVYTRVPSLRVYIRHVRKWMIVDSPPLGFLRVYSQRKTSTSVFVTQKDYSLFYAGYAYS